MAARSKSAARVIALVGPSGGGKTILMQSLKKAAEVFEAPGKQAGVIELRQSGPSTEVGLTAFDFMGERFALLDLPGSLEFIAETDYALPAADLALVVADPDPSKAHLLQPYLRELERLNVPHAIFVNKIDTAYSNVNEVLEALQPYSASPLVARQIPIFKGEVPSGFVDLALERAYEYQSGAASRQVNIPSSLAAQETDARFHMLEQIANFDDALLETLLNDEAPSQDCIMGDLARELQDALIVPVFFGSATQTFGLRRLLKALRHEAPQPDKAAARLGVTAPGAYVFKVSHAGQAGKLSYARVLNGRLTDGGEIHLPGGAATKVNGLMGLNGNQFARTEAGELGQIVGIGKIDALQSGETIGLNGNPLAKKSAIPPRHSVYALAIAAADHKDDVRLSSALNKLLEEDRGLHVDHLQDTHETLLSGQGDTHLKVNLERLKRRYNLDVSARRPATGYKESIRKAVTQRGRHKKQTGGHGQFGDVLLEIHPSPRGDGFTFGDRITGGVVPKQWIPAVEQGARDALVKGPLGFPVIDVAVTLIDGSFHSVDSSEQSFRSAGRLGVSEALEKCESYLLEPVEKLVVLAPSSATPRINSTASAKHGQILGFEPREGWTEWDRIELYLPHAERQDFIIELRALTQGMGTFESTFDHMSDLTGRRADDVAKAARSAA
ncbi:MAG: elongation factor G [Caulobacterales bacterium]